MLLHPQKFGSASKASASKAKELVSQIYWLRSLNRKFLDWSSIDKLRNVEMEAGNLPIYSVRITAFPFKPVSPLIRYFLRVGRRIHEF